MHVVDTDYKNYMITYWCHEEYRMPVEGTDDLTKYWEDYRTFKEEGRKRTTYEVSHEIGNALWEHEMFQNFKDQIT